MVDGASVESSGAVDVCAVGDRAAGERAVTCGFCGAEFLEDRSQATCQACPLSRACGLMRCPSCGYENPRSPRWLASVRKWIRG